MAILSKEAEVKAGVAELMKNSNIRDDISEFEENDQLHKQIE